MERPAEAYQYIVKNPATGETFPAAYGALLGKGVKVLAETRYGLDLCEVAGPKIPYTCPHTECGDCPEPPKPEKVKISDDAKWIERVADDVDLAKYEANAADEQSALIACREKVEKLKLDMKVTSAHYLLGEPKVLFFFTSDGRIDFRELVRELVTIFKMRIELRQIGVRDETRSLGGLAVCGRDFCCHGFNVIDKIPPVTIKMPKEQNLSLNTSKISGACGRLLCCLSFENEFYQSEKQKYPSEGAKIAVRGEVMKVKEVQLLSRKISIASPDGASITVPGESIYFDDDSRMWEVRNEYLDENGL